MPHEAVDHTFGVAVISSKFTGLVDALRRGDGAHDVALFIGVWPSVRNGSRSIEGSERAARMPQKTVDRVVRSRKVVPRDLSVVVHGHRKGAPALRCIRA